MAFPSITYTFVNATTASPTEVNTNFTDIINGFSDGTKDINVSAITAAGAVTLNGDMTLGNSSADLLTVTASLNSTVSINTTNTYNIGSSTKGLAGIYFGGNSQTTRIVGSASMSATYTFTLPVSAGTSRYRLETDGSGVTSWQPVRRTITDSQNIGLTASVAANALTIALKGADGSDPSSTNPVDIVFRNATATTGTPSVVTSTAATSVVVSSGSTLGHVSAVDQYVYVYAINNAGTIELAVCRTFVGNESIVTTTGEGGGGAADSGTVVYSTTARSNVAIQLIGRLKSNQAAAGTWATAIAEISLTTFAAPNITDWVSYTPTITGYGTATGVSFHSRRVGDSLEMRGQFGAGTPTAVDNKITVGFNGTSANVTVDTSKVGGNTIVGKANGTDFGAATFSFGVLAPATNDTHVQLGKQSTTVSEATAGQDGDIIISTGGGLQLRCTVPIVGWYTYGP